MTRSAKSYHDEHLARHDALQGRRHRHDAAGEEGGRTFFSNAPGTSEGGGAGTSGTTSASGIDAAQGGSESEKNMMPSGAGTGAEGGGSVSSGSGYDSVRRDGVAEGGSSGEETTAALGEGTTGAEGGGRPSGATENVSWSGTGR